MDAQVSLFTDKPFDLIGFKSHNVWQKPLTSRLTLCLYDCFNVFKSRSVKGLLK